MIRAAARFAAVAFLAGHPAAAECPFPADQPILVVQLFFGQTMDRGRAVTAAEWLDFLHTTVTPAFPDGFTVYDGSGQWLDQKHRRLVREKTKIIELAVADTDAAKGAVETVAAAYKRRFHQQTVGVISNLACGNFNP